MASELEQIITSNCRVVDCGRDVHASGYCNMHYLRWWRQGEAGEVAPRRIFGRARTEYMKLYFDNHYFGGLREQIIQEGGEKCKLCGLSRQQHRINYGRDLTVDHIDGRGRYSVVKNNDPANLQALCLRCHGKKDHRRKNWIRRTTQ